MIAYDLINDALALVGFSAFGEAPEPEAAALGMRCLNSLLAEWSTKAHMNPRQFVGTFVSTGTPSISLGTGGNISTNPVDIAQVTVESGPTVWRVRPQTLAEYQRTYNKTTPGVPRFCAWDRQAPLSQLYLFPVPPAGYTIKVVGRDAIPSITAPQSTLSLPDYYAEAVTFVLAKRMLPFMPSTNDPAVIAKIEEGAASAVNGIKALNRKMRDQRLVSDLAPGRDSSYWTWSGRWV